MKNIELTPADFCKVYPFESVHRSAESETVAMNIMRILKRTENTWRKLTWKEYVDERNKDGNFDDAEKKYFDACISYTLSPNTAVLYSQEWANIEEI